MQQHAENLSAEADAKRIEKAVKPIPLSFYFPSDRGFILGSSHSGALVELETGFSDKDLEKAVNILGRKAHNPGKTAPASLKVAVTLDCNFECPYCFERCKRRLSIDWSKLKHDVLTAAGNEKFFHVSLFGGEPLLERENILKFMSLLNKENKRTFFTGSLVTNGYLLSKDFVARAPWLRKVQITLDGPPEVHDKRRFLKGGKGTFWRIWSNMLHYLYSSSGLLVIRSNLDRNNLHEYSGLLDMLEQEVKGFSDRVIVRPERVDAVPGYGQDRVIPEGEWWDIYPELVRKIMERGLDPGKLVDFSILKCPGAEGLKKVIYPPFERTTCDYLIGNNPSPELEKRIMEAGPKSSCKDCAFIGFCDVCPALRVFGTGGECPKEFLKKRMVLERERRDKHRSWHISPARGRKSLVGLWKKAIRDTPYEEYPEKVFLDHEEESEFDLVLLKNSEPVAGAVLVPEEDGTLTMEWLFSAEKGKGFGRRLVEYSFDLARAKGFKGLRAEAMMLSPESLKFFTRMGFEFERFGFPDPETKKEISLEEYMKKTSGKARWSWMYLVKKPHAPKTLRIS